MFHIKLEGLPAWKNKVHLKRFASISFLFVFLLSGGAAAQVPEPKSVLGFQPAEEKTIADWGQIRDYFKKLDSGSPRVSIREFGVSTLGKPMIAAFISSEANIAGLEKYRQINAKIADPRKVKDKVEMESLVKQGKTIVSISCSIHSNEIVASQMSMNLAYELASAKDPETLEILNNTILILIPSSNPDGIDIVANWYRKTLGTPYEGSVPPELYHYYAGHDNNRDWFMMNLAETRAITKLYWQEWFPQIVYDVHQMGQNGARFIIPPFYDPPNPNIPPLILREVGLIGYKMAADLQAANMAGVATNTTFDTWWHGGFRSAPYYHNSIGILSEAASANLMTPITISEDKMKDQQARGLNSPFEASTSHPMPWKPGKWGPRDIAKLEMIASRALLEMAAKFRENYLRNFYGLNLKASEKTSLPDAPVAYAIISGQGREEVVARFMEILMWQGIEVHRINSELMVSFLGDRLAHTEIPLDSFIIFLDQPQRNNVEALLGTQVYPERLNAGGEAEVPYDVAGWTLPLQMGIEYKALAHILESKEHPIKLERMKDTSQIRQTLNLPPAKDSFQKLTNPLKTAPKTGLYKGSMGAMDEGWTRLVFDTYQLPFASVSDGDMREGRLGYDSIILPSQSAASISNGLSERDYPAEFTGGISAKGLANLKKYVEAGGKLICFDASCSLAIKEFGLPLKNSLSGLKRSEFYCPGSILQVDLDRSHPLAKGLPPSLPAYFINSSAFEIEDGAKVKAIAKYAREDTLLSGWLLGEKYLRGKTAIAEAAYGKGKIILFAFRPQHRGQSFATFPLIFNALEKEAR